MNLSLHSSNPTIQIQVWHVMDMCCVPIWLYIFSQFDHPISLKFYRHQYVTILLHFFTHETSWISCIFLTWAWKPFNGLLANIKPLSLTIQAIPIETKSKKKKKLLDCTKLEYYKEILVFTYIEYHIIFFFNYTNSKLAVPRCRFTRNSSSLNSSTI